MGRPLQPPTIKPLYREDGTVRSYLITATVGGKQRKKHRPTMDQAKDLMRKWQGYGRLTKAIIEYTTRLSRSLVEHWEAGLLPGMSNRCFRPPLKRSVTLNANTPAPHVGENPQDPQLSGQYNGRRRIVVRVQLA
ncbi:MAG: hypothetical protein PSV13_14125 [Lacunisphaera sp.]|nr:hypothetical protein [Lacunisphaera sp.]